jgi:hypothetical protein
MKTQKIIIRSSDGCKLVAGYHFNSILEAFKRGDNCVYFNSKDIVTIQGSSDEDGVLNIRTSQLQDIILKD